MTLRAPNVIKARDKKYSDLVGALSNMFEDPVVDSILQNNYKFNLLPNYIKSLRYTRNQLDQLEKEGNDYLYKVDLMINFSRRVLCWSLIRDINEEWSDFQSQFKIKCPDAWKMSLDLVSLINKVGLDTTEKQRILFALIVKRYGLKEQLYLV